MDWYVDCVSYLLSTFYSNRQILYKVFYEIHYSREETHGKEGRRYTHVFGCSFCAVLFLWEIMVQQQCDYSHVSCDNRKVTIFK